MDFGRFRKQNGRQIEGNDSISEKKKGLELWSYRSYIYMPNKLEKKIH